MSGLVSGFRVWFVFGSCLVRVRFVIVSYPVRIWFVSYDGFVLGLVRIWIHASHACMFFSYARACLLMPACSRGFFFYMYVITYILALEVYVPPSSSFS